MKFKRTLVNLAVALLAYTGTTLPVSAQSVTRTITPIKGDVYRFDNNYHSAMFVETPDGIVITDPINREAALWLKAELKRRFKKDAKLMIMSHAHADHTSGGEVFEDTAKVITHKNFVPHILAGHLKTAMPDITFRDEYTYEFGGKTFEMTYLGVGHGNDLIVTIVRPENVAFVVDAVSPHRIMYGSIPTNDLDGYLNQIRTVESLDFEILLPGHDILGTKKDATEARIYLETLRDRVAAELKKGKSVKEIVETVTMDEYKDWGMYDRFIKHNVVGMIRLLSTPKR